MSTPLIPADRWSANISQADIPANNNARRFDVSQCAIVSASTTTEPSLTSPADDGNAYIIPSGATGTQWSTFAVDSIAIFYGGTFTEYPPVDGQRKYVQDEDANWQFKDGSGWAVEAGGGGGSDRSDVTALATSGSVGIDYAQGDYFTLALAGNVSGLTFSNLPGSGKGATLMVRITQDSTPRTVAWPASFRWAGGAAGVVSTPSGAVDVLAITTFDNGTTWDATLANGFA